MGVGSFVAALPRLIRAPRPELGLTWERMARRVDRTHVALETTGLGAIAVGSVVLAVTELGPWWFEAGVVLLAGLAVYLISAMKMRQLWLMRAATARDDPSATPAIASAPEQRVLALDHARWRRCLQRAFSKDLSWPPAPGSPDLDSSEAAKLEPRHIAELHERDARLEDLSIPESIRADVAAIREQGYQVRVVDDLIVVTGPDGRAAHASRSTLAPNSVVAVATRQRFLHDLEALGLQVRPGPKGQPHVAGASERRLTDSPER